MVSTVPMMTKSILINCNAFLFVSDSPESTAREIEIFFPHFSIPEWLRDYNHEPIVHGRHTGVNR
jgi:hypothetical protein